MAPKAALAVVLMLCCASVALATYECKYDYDCKAHNQCSYGKCSYGTCVYKYKADYTPCRDGNYCTEGDYCKAGKCLSGKPKTCPDAYPKNPCKKPYCNPKDGSCSFIDRPKGYSCDDGNKCTSYDTCSYGLCAGTPKVCKSGPCYKSYCYKHTGECKKQYYPDGTKCSDSYVSDGRCKGHKCVAKKYYG